MSLSVVELAEKWGITRARVYQLVKSGRIQSVNTGWRLEFDENLQKPDRLEGGSPPNLLDKHPELRDLLGTKPDRVLGEEYGVGPSTICDLRNAAGIPAYRGWGKLLKYQKHNAKILLLSDSKSDTEIAAELDIPVSYIRYYRCSINNRKRPTE